MTGVQTCALPISGKPVIGLGRGGLLETVIDGETGVLFPEPTVASLIEGVSRFAPGDFDAAKLSRHAASFSKERFRREIADFVAARLDEAAAGPGGRSEKKA